MSKKTANGILHVLAQILAQGAVVELVPVTYKPWLMAIVAIVGVLVAYSDQTLSQ